MSKLVNQSRLQQFATKLWEKIKGRYDNAFVEAEIPATEKKIKFTKADNTIKNVSLADYARLQDRNKFKKDVSVDDAKVVSNANVGSINGTVPAGSRTTGYRGLTSKLFTDGYVKSLRIYLPANTGDTINAHVWMIKKGASKAEDKFLEPKIVKAAPVLTSGANKYIDVEIEREFTEETFFVLRTERNQQIQGIDHIKQEFAKDIINVDDRFNPTSTDENANWGTYDPRTDLVGHMELHGRTGIVDISKRLEEIGLASGNYVKHSETTATGGTDNANKVVKLDEQGKLSESMLPAIALNEFFPVTANTWNEAALNNVTYQNGDIIYHTNTQKRYLCINRNETFANRFVELNSKDGVVSTVNDKTGAVVLNLEATENLLKLKIGNGSGTDVEKSVDIISDTEITEILDALQ